MPDSTPSASCSSSCPRICVGGFWSVGYLQASVAVTKGGRQESCGTSLDRQVRSAPVTDINVFVCRSQRNARREAGLALIRQQVNAGKLKVSWMSEEEKAAYRLRGPLEARADRGGGL